MPYEMVDQTRVNFTGLLTDREVEGLLANSEIGVLQFDRPVDPGNWPKLQAGLFSKRPDVALRVYGHYRDACDLAFVSELPSLQRFRADCLTNATGVGAIAELTNLRELSVGIYELTSFDFLHDVSDRLETLRLDETRSKRPQLDALSRFTQLRELVVSGHTKQLHRSADLPLLEKLRLTRLKSPDLGFLESAPKLWWLEFTLGGSRDLSAIASIDNLKHLEVCWVRGLGDLSFISRCANLQRLIIDRLKQVRHLPDFTSLKRLRALSLCTLRGLESVDPIQRAPALEWFGFGDASNFQPEDFRRALQAPSLKQATVGFGSDKRNRLFEQIAAEYGIETEVKYQEFQFRS